MAWRAGKSLVLTVKPDLHRNYLQFLSTHLFLLKDGSLQFTQSGAAKESLPTGEKQHVRHLNISNFHGLSLTCRQC